MRSLIAFSLTMVALLSQSAFAKNLGVLSDDKKPQNLLSAQEFINGSSATDVNRADEPQNLTNDARRGWHGGGYHHNYYPSYGYNYYPSYGYGSYYPSYYYPYYYYPSYGYGYGHHRWRHLDDNSQNNLSGESTNNVGDLDASHVPVVCFAEDTSGNMYADASGALDAAATQEKVNKECLSSGVSCSQNLGCAVAYGD